MELKKINIKQIDRQKGFDFMDEIRDGRSSDVDVMKLAAMLLVIVETENQLIDSVLQIAENNKPQQHTCSADQTIQELKQQIETVKKVQEGMGDMILQLQRKRKVSTLKERMIKK